MIPYSDITNIFPKHSIGGKMKKPTIKSTYKDVNRKITFEVMFYSPLNEKQVHQILDEYYRRYEAPFPENGSTVKIVCDDYGPRSPASMPI